MIVPMKSLTIVTLKSEQQQALERLQNLGILHLVHAQAPAEEVVAKTRTRLLELQQAAELLKKHARKADAPAAPKAATRPATPKPATEVVAEVQRLAERLRDLQAKREGLSQEINRLTPFGPFNPETVRGLEEEGIAVKLLRASLRHKLAAPAESLLYEVRRDKQHAYLVLIGPTNVVQDAVLNADDVPLPEVSLAALQEDLGATDRALEETQEALGALAPHLSAVAALADQTEDRLQFEEARAGMAVSGTLAHLRGFCPERDVPRVRQQADLHGWGLLVEDVTDPSQVPTKIETPRWVESIRPVFSFIGIVPGYDQVDISAPFLVFFSLFFAMIIGDAGYGLLFLGLTLLGQRRFKDVPRNVFKLLKLLSVLTIIWGALTGNVFGIAALPAPLALLRLDWLTQEDNIILLSFIIGTLHLTLAHGWNVVRFLNSTRALAQLGWIGTTWTMFFLARNLVLGHDFPSIMTPVFVVSLLFILLFMTPWRELKAGWFNHAMLPLTLVNNFVDVISYVRLFAVGAATFAVASAFNDMALASNTGGFVPGVVAALILFFGHTLNILLAAMGVLVHGIRLNTLEFAGHLGLAWNGFPYKPFARKARREGAL